MLNKPIHSLTHSWLREREASEHNGHFQDFAKLNGVPRFQVPPVFTVGKGLVVSRSIILLRVVSRTVPENANASGF